MGIYFKAKNRGCRFFLSVKFAMSLLASLPGDNKNFRAHIMQCFFKSTNTFKMIKSDDLKAAISFWQSAES